MSISIKQVSWSDSHDILTKIRMQVFVEEQKVPKHMELDDEDEYCVHIIAYKDNTPVGTSRLNKGGKIERMCVLKNWRNQGIARRYQPGSLSSWPMEAGWLCQ